MRTIPDHHFNPVLAQTYGVDAAVFLHNIYFWLKHNKAYEKNFYEGRYWTFNSLAAFCEAHPYWSRRQIERIISACKKNSLLLTGCFNQDKRDRTSWYSLSDKAMAYFSECATEVAGCISPNGEMQNTESDGWLTCPRCRKNKRLMKVRPDTQGSRMIAYCRVCKNEILIDVNRGACFESQGQ